MRRPAARAGFQDVIERNLTRLVRLTDQLAMMSRLKTTTDNTQTQHLPLGLVAREVARQLRDMADRRGVTIVIRRRLPVLEVDVAAVELILVNLVSNAIKYWIPPSRRGSSRCAASRDPTPGDRGRDNGVGIPPDHLPRIFERAYRAHADRDEELGTDGLGLGLAIVRDCVKDQGGEVSVESVPG